MNGEDAKNTNMNDEDAKNNSMDVKQTTMAGRNAKKTTMAGENAKKATMAGKDAKKAAMDDRDPKNITIDSEGAMNYDQYGKEPHKPWDGGGGRAPSQHDQDNVNPHDNEHHVQQGWIGGPRQVGLAHHQPDHQQRQRATHDTRNFKYKDI